MTLLSPFSFLPASFLLSPFSFLLASFLPSPCLLNLNLSLNLILFFIPLRCSFPGASISVCYKFFAALLLSESGKTAPCFIYQLHYILPQILSLLNSRSTLHAPRSTLHAPFSFLLSPFTFHLSPCPMLPALCSLPLAPCSLPTHPHPHPQPHPQPQPVEGVNLIPLVANCPLRLNTEH